MAYKFVHGIGTYDYYHFWFRNNLTGRYTEFTVPEHLIERAMRSKENYCEVLEAIIKKLEEEKFYEPAKTEVPRH